MAPLLSGCRKILGYDSFRLSDNGGASGESSGSNAETSSGGKGTSSKSTQRETMGGTGTLTRALPDGGSSTSQSSGGTGLGGTSGVASTDGTHFIPNGGSVTQGDSAMGGASQSTSLGGVSGGTATSPDVCGQSGAGITQASSPLGTGFGAVWITTPDGHCAGTLISNRWILTANTCLDCRRSACELRVQYGDQLTVASEVVRYPGGNCNPGRPTESHDIMLVRLAQPMRVNGSETGYYQTPTIWDSGWFNSSNPDRIFENLTCVGWDLSPGQNWVGPQWKTGTFTTFESQPNSLDAENHSMGDQLWLTNTVFNAPERGLLLTPNDQGAACWAKTADKYFFVGVSSWAPLLINKYAPNSKLEARLAAISDPDNYQFLWDTLFGTFTFNGFTPGSAFAAAVISPTVTDYFWVDNSGVLQSRRRQNDTMAAIETLGSPTTDAAFLVEQPAVTVVDSAHLWVWLRDNKNQLWSRLRSGDTWSTWRMIEAPALSQGVSATLFGNKLLLFGVTTEKKLQLTTQNLSGEMISDWSFVPGTPANVDWIDKPSLVGDTAINIHVLGSDGRVWANAMRMDDTWVFPNMVVRFEGINIASGPYLGSWGPLRHDDFYRDSSGQLRLETQDGNWWVSHQLKFDVPLDRTGSPIAVTVPFAGSYELAIRTGDTLRILRYPR